MTDMASLQATVRGRVQGVFFRTFVEGVAEQLRLTGYVRNCPGGVVEVKAEGEKPKLEKLVDYLKTGPPAAKVDNVEVDWADYSGGFTDFKIR
jgi:acylphosphatase